MKAVIPVVQMNNISKVYRTGSRQRMVEIHALRQADVCIEHGEYAAIMGPSGSGKSTLMNLIGLLDTPTTGSYFLSGLEVAKLSEPEQATVRNEKIGFVFQAFFLMAKLRALENVALPLVYRAIPRAERLRRAALALEQVGLAERLDHYPSELSGGQKQRVAIARALVQEPDILLADEPTGALDTRSSGEILELFGDLHQQGKTVIVVTHDRDVAAKAKRLIQVRDGVVEG